MSFADDANVVRTDAKLDLNSCDGFVITKRARKVNGQGNHHIGMAQHAENDWD